MHLSGFDLWLWLAGFLEIVVLLGVLWKYKRVSEFPIFTVFVVLLVSKTIALALVYRFGSAYAYYYTYLGLDLLDSLIQVGVAYEIALHVFRPRGRWSVGAKDVFVTGFSVAVVFSSLLAWLALPPTAYLADSLMIRGDLLSAALMSELFVGMLFLSVRLGVPWRTHVARLSQGFGVFALLCVIAEALHTYFGVASSTRAFSVISRCRIVVFQLSTIYWIVSFARAAPSERQLPEALRKNLLELQSRAHSMLALVRSSKA